MELHFGTLSDTFEIFINLLFYDMLEARKMWYLFDLLKFQRKRTMPDSCNKNLIFGYIIFYPLGATAIFSMFEAAVSDDVTKADMACTWKEVVQPEQRKTAL